MPKTDFRDGRDEMPFALHALGYDFNDIVEKGAEMGWHPVPSWGRDGWDLGEWPYLAVFVKGPNQLAIYCEGDVAISTYDTRDERNAHIDRWALENWKLHERAWVKTRSQADLTGPFSWKRLETETAVPAVPA